MTYDDRQITAPLIVCGKCGKSYFMTLHQPWCVTCRRAQP